MESAHVIGDRWCWVSVYFSLLCSCLRAHAHRLYILATTCRIPLAWALHPWGITPLHTNCLNRTSIGWSTLAPSRACILSAHSAPRSCISSCNSDHDIILFCYASPHPISLSSCPSSFAPTYLSSPPLKCFLHFSTNISPSLHSRNSLQSAWNSGMIPLAFFAFDYQSQKNREQWFRLTPNMK